MFKFNQKAAMFGLEAGALRKQSGGLFLAKLRKLTFRLVAGQQATRLKTQSAAMFGLDARIALLILAITAMSIGLNQEKVSKQEREIQTRQSLKTYRYMFLKNWEKLRFDGYYKVLANALVNLKANAGSDGRIVYKTAQTGRSASISANANYTHPYNGKTYNSYTANVLATSNSVPITHVLNYTTLDGYYSAPGSNAGLLGARILQDIHYRISTVFTNIINQHGARTAKAVNVSSRNYYYFKDEGYDDYIVPHYLVEFNVNHYSPADYILRVMLVAKGGNGRIDSTLPKNLAEWDSFTPSGDDIVEVFSTKDIYARAKIEHENRLGKIRERIMNLAEFNYAEFISACTNESTVSATCDVNSDGNYDAKDRLVHKDYNYFFKSDLDTSSATYEDSTVIQMPEQGDGNYFSGAGYAEDFLVDNLSLPRYYAVDLFGNILTYNSNVYNSDTGPYTMEVYY